MNPFFANWGGRKPIVLALLVLILAAAVSCGRRPTNTLEVHLQENWNGNDEIIITVKGREVYRDKPKSDIITGGACAVLVSNVSEHPIVTFTMPHKGIYWSNQVELIDGDSIGFSGRGDNHIIVRQASEFSYE
jgi:hypothetical protein